tara:strand:- start:488 stop:862 length:375 start_codon:yes stop_codon:yes gene_type:complete
VEIKKIIFCICSFLLLNGCLQSTAMVGPSISLAGGGSIYQTSLSYGASKAFEEETGMTTTEFIISTLDNQNQKNEIKEKKIKEDLYRLVKNNLEKTRKQNELIILVKSNLVKTKKKLIINSDTN